MAKSVVSLHLQGIDFGIHTIRKAVEQLREEIPTLSTFSSLSPIPLFSRWLRGQLKQQLQEPTPARGLLPQEVAAALKSQFGLTTDAEMYAFMLEILDAQTWKENQEARERLRGPLMHLCARYLCEVKRPGTTGYAADPVANFHLRNGAQIWRLNWAAVSNSTGYKQSLGMMVNYRYFLDELNDNSAAYLLRKEAKRSSTIEALLH